MCPYFLAQEMARWCDLVVADVNRMFDQSALLHGLIRQNNWRASVLVDEAHNLVDRARGMYSVQLEQQRLAREVAVLTGVFTTLKGSSPTL